MSIQRREPQPKWGPSIAFSHHTLLLEALKAESLSSISLALDRLHAWIDIPARRYPVRITYQNYTIGRYRDHMAVYPGPLLEPSLSPVLPDDHILVDVHYPKYRIRF